MRNLIVCCDGTWNDSDNADDGVPAPTNVRKLFDAIDLHSQNPVQLSRYQSGVGSGGIVDKVLGGALGFGLGEDIRDCYQWLSDKYQPGDHIYIFGFSRGAFTARSLAGMIGKFGLVDFSQNCGKTRDHLVKKIYREGYREGNALSNVIQFHPNSTAVEFIGVWDTVGALGVPDDKSLLNIFDNPRKYEFHDVKLGDNVHQARHAVALNEQRGSFTPTLWEADRSDDSLKQVWFPGVHSDIGGGYKECGLSDVALRWMIDEVTGNDRLPGNGLALKEQMLSQIKPDAKGMLHESYTGAMKALLSAPRTIPDLDCIDASVHESVHARRESPPISQGSYMNTRAFGEGAIEIDIYAKHPWNWTGVFLEAGKRYRFKARGEWMDASIVASAEGTNDGVFYRGEIAHLFGSASGFLENRFKDIFKNEEANFVGSKRVEHADWFCLMGAIANGGNPGVDGTPNPLRQFVIGEGTEIEVERSGYLYCFANDAWGFYGNNRGYVTLEIDEI